MAVVHYKFKNSVEYDSLTFDGLAISLRDLKAGILRKKHMRAEDTDLQIVNAQNGEEYSSPSMMIPKNTSLIIARIPVGGVKKPENVTPQTKAKEWAAFRARTRADITAAETGGYNTEKIEQSSDLVNKPSTETEKIAEMIKQSTKDFDPSNYTYKFPSGVPNPSYICRRCGKGGHFIQNCNNDPLEASNSPSDSFRMKRPTGIPIDSMVFVDTPLPGTYKTHSGKYAVPKIDVEAYAVGKKERPPFLPDKEKKVTVVKKPVPDGLKCALCGDLAKDAVVIPCCGISYCDECIRNKLLETEDHVCPSCDSMDVSPDGLIPNQMLRRAVTNFQNETGYVKIAQNQVKLAQAKAAEAAKAAALLKQPIVPRGPSVLDYKPPPKPPTPPPQPVQTVAKTITPTVVSSAQSNSVSGSQQPVLSTPQKSSIPVSMTQEPPTPTLDEPNRTINYPQPQRPPPGTVAHSVAQIEAVPTLVSGTVSSVNRVIGQPGYDPYYKPPPVSGNLGLPPPPRAGLLPYPPPTAYPPPVVPPPFPMPPSIPPVVVAPAVVPPGFPPGLPRPAVPPPPMNMPKPLSEQEFWEEKKRLMREEERKAGIRIVDPVLEFQKELDQRKQKTFTRSRSRSPRPIRSRSRSLSRPRYRSRSPRKRSFSRSPRRSLTPRRSSLSPRRSYSPRRYSPRRSRSPRYSPKRYYSPRRSPSRRSLSPRPRYRSYSRSPVRRRSRSRSWRRSPLRRSYSRSPIRRSPFRRSRSRGRYSPRRSPYRSPPPYRKSPIRRSSRDRSLTPVKQGYNSRGRSPMGLPPKRRSLSRDRNIPADKPPTKPLKGGKKNITGGKKNISKNKNNMPVEKLPNKTDSQSNENVNNNQNKTNEPNKENIPSVKPRSNNIVVNLIDHSSATTGGETSDNAEKTDTEVKEPKNENKDKAVEQSNNKDAVKSSSDTQDSQAEDKKVEAKSTKETTKDSKETKTNVKSVSKTDKKSADPKGRSKSRSKSVEKSEKVTKPKRRRSPVKKKAKSRSLSESPERVKEPLKMPFRGDRDNKRFEDSQKGLPNSTKNREGFNANNREGLIAGSNREGFSNNRDRYSNNRDWDRNDGPRIIDQRDPYFRGRQNAGYRGRDFRGSGRGGRNNDFRQDFRSGRPNQDFRGGSQQAPDFRGFPPMPDPMALPGTFNRDFPPQMPPGYPGNFPANFPYPPPRDPREDPNFQGMVRDEDIVKFEQYKQMYDFYSRTYGFPPSGGTTLPSGQTPPQGPPPAPPGTTPLLATSPSRRRSPSPRRRRSRSPGRRDGGDKPERDYRDKRSPDRRRDERSDRDDRSPERKRYHSPDRKRTYSTDRRDVSQSDRDSSSPDKRPKDPEERERKKDKKAKKKKEKGEGVEKKKKKKKDKEKSKKKLKLEKRSKKAADEDSSDEEDVERASGKHDDSENDSGSDSEVEKRVVTKKRKPSVKEEQSDLSESSDHEPPPVKTKKIKKLKKEAKVAQSDDSDKESVKSKASVKSSHSVKSSQGSIKSSKTSKVSVKKEEKAEGEDHTKMQTESSPVKEEVEDVKTTDIKLEKRRSLKRAQPEPPNTSESSDKKKVKLEQVATEENTEEKMNISGGKSPAESEDMDDIPPPEDELMLDPPELSKWEKEDDPYDLSPEPSRKRELPKKTFLPRSVIEKAEQAFAQKQMKPTTVSSSVTVPAVKKEAKSETKEPAVVPRKPHREKSPVTSPPQRRVFMETEKAKEERRVASSKQQHSVKVTVTGDERRKVATGGEKKKASEKIDLRAKLSEKRRGEERHSRDYERERDRESERDLDRRRKDSSSHMDRRSSRDYDRTESRGSKGESSKSGKQYSRKESVIDDSKFEPDYNDESHSEDNASNDSSSDSSSEEEYVKRKHKHKKNKHKKEKKQKKKKEKKKKKQKLEKEKKVKSSHGK